MQPVCGGVSGIIISEPMFKNRITNYQLLHLGVMGMRTFREMAESPQAGI